MTQDRKNELYDKMIAWFTEHFEDDDELFEVLAEDLGMTQDELHDHSIEDLDKFFPPAGARLELKQKLEKCYADCKTGWLKLKPATLINLAEEIFTACQMVKYLPSSLSESEAEDLLRFKNPLEIATEAWMNYESVTYEEIEFAMWMFQEEDDLSENFEMEPVSIEKPVESQIGITIREFMQNHPNAGLEMMTPVGYVHIPPGQYSEIVKYGQIPAHLGASGTDYYIAVDEILSQEIRSINQSPEDPALFYVLSVEPEQGEETENHDYDMTI